MESKSDELRPFRLGVRLLQIETNTAGDPFCKLSVEGCAPERSVTAPKGKVPEWESHFSFFVGDPATASLTLDAFIADSMAASAAKAAASAASTMKFSFSSTGDTQGKRVSQPAGSVSIQLAKFVWSEGEPFPAAQWYELSGGRGGGTQGVHYGQTVRGGGRGVGGGRVRVQLVVIQGPPASAVAELNVLVGTWNVGNERPPTDLSDWLDVRGKTGGGAGGGDGDGDCVPESWGAYAMVVVGCQEGDYKERAPHESCEDDWFAGIAATLGDSYVAHCKNTLGQMRVAAFVRADVAPAVHHWQKSTEATGLGHVLANKGGVGIACRVWDTSLCFLNSHLAAHDDMCARRNDDFAEIVGGCMFGEKLECTQAFHHLVWMGDLNYRCEWGLGGEDANDGAGDESSSPALSSPSSSKVDRTPSKQRVKKMIKALGAVDDPAARAQVFKTDQLTRARLAGDAFLGFEEGDPARAHMPTFKVQRKPGFEYKEQRTPAWCDRVLWKTAEGIACRQTLLTAAGNIGTSDHKPVAAALAMEIIAHPATVHFEDDKDAEEDAQDLAAAAAPATATTAEDVQLSVAGEPPTSDAEAASASVAASASPAAPPDGARKKRMVRKQMFGKHAAQSSMFQAIFGPCCGFRADEVAAAGAEWVLRFSSLAAKNLISADINGLSDPYVIFGGLILAAPPSDQRRKIGTHPRWMTSTVTRNLNPTWKCPGQVPPLPLVVAEPAVIRREYLSFRVMDEDTLTSDDPIGYGRLFLGPLGDAMAEGKEGSIETTIMLTFNGRRAGELSLKVTLERTKPSAAK